MKEIVAVLSNVRSIHNVGSMFRTADSAGIKKVYLCGITPKPTDVFDAVRPEFAKVSLGAEKYLDWVHVRSTVAVMNALKKEGYTVVALEQSPRAEQYRRMRAMGKKIAIVVGNEVSGLPRNVIQTADRVVDIPMLGKKESLNVSVAFGIAVYGARY